MYIHCWLEVAEEAAAAGGWACGVLV